MRPRPDAPLSTFVAPGLLTTGAADPGDWPEIGVRGAAVRGRVIAGRPLTPRL